MIGPNVSTSDLDRFTQLTTDLERRISELERRKTDPRGLVGNGPSFDGATSGTTKLNIGSTQVLALKAGRKYVARLELSGGWYGTQVGDVFNIGMELDGSQLVNLIPVQIDVGNNYLPPCSMMRLFTTTTGDHVIQGSAQRQSGTGILQFRGQIFVYDEGPVAV